MKKYQVKHYDKTKVFKQTINEKILKNRISFSCQINGGLGQLVLLLNLPITNNDFIEGDIIEVSVKQEDGIMQLIYQGFIDDIIKKATQFEELRINCVGLFGFFSRLHYEEASDYTINKTGDPATLVGDIKTFFNGKYNLITSDATLVGSNVSYDTDFTDLFEFMNDLKDLSDGYYWFLGQDGILQFKPIASAARNKFTFKKDIFKLEVDEDGLKIYNRLILTHKTTTTVYNDVTSQTTYGIREKRINNTQIADQISADDFGNKFIEDNKDPKKKITMTVNTDYMFDSFLLVEELTDQVNDYTQTIDELFDTLNIESIQPGETCKILNIKEDFGSNLLISKKVYNQYEVTLYLESFDDLISLIRN